MPIDWDKFQSELDDSIEAAGEKTDRKLAGQIASITRLTEEDVQRLFPDPADVKKIAALMEIVKGSTAQNEKINAIVSNIKDFAGVAVTLLAKFV